MEIVLRRFRAGGCFRRIKISQFVEFDGDEFVSMDGLLTNGLYDFLNGQVLIVYAHEGQVFIVVGSACLSLSEMAADVKYEDADGGKKLSLFRSGGLIGSVKYAVPVDDRLMDQTFFSVEVSDFDIGHFIHQLATSKERQRDKVQVWSGGSRHS